MNDTGEFHGELFFDRILGYRFATKPVIVSFSNNMLNEFKQLSTSPELFATTLIARYDVLQTEIERQIVTGELVDTTGNELSVVLQYIQAKRELINSNTPQLHAVLTQHVNVSRCE